MEGYNSNPKAIKQGTGGHPMLHHVQIVLVLDKKVSLQGTIDGISDSIATTKLTKMCPGDYEPTETGHIQCRHIILSLFKIIFLTIFLPRLPRTFTYMINFI